MHLAFVQQLETLINIPSWTDSSTDVIYKRSPLRNGKVLFKWRTELDESTNHDRGENLVLVWCVYFSGCFLMSPGRSSNVTREAEVARVLFFPLYALTENFYNHAMQREDKGNALFCPTSKRLSLFPTENPVIDDGRGKRPGKETRGARVQREAACSV